MNHLDFSISTATFSAIIIGGSLPLYLFFIVRIPVLLGRNGLQYLFSSIFMFFLWICVYIIIPKKDALRISEICFGMMILASFSTFYLEIWALLTRGYTLGILLTIFREDIPLGEKEIADKYRGGKGLYWILEHRLSGLAKAGIISINKDNVILTAILGVLIARLYKISILILGMRKT